MFEGGQKVESEEVTTPSQPGDLPLGYGGDYGMAAETFSGVDVADMHLDDGYVCVGEGVSQRVAVVGKGAWVDDDAVVELPVFLDEVYYRAFTVGLEAGNLMAHAGRLVGHALFDILQCR